MAEKLTTFYRVSFSKGGTEFIDDGFTAYLPAAVEASRVANWHGNARLARIEMNEAGKTVFISDALPY